jgi:serine phosphatase RsbU (regulator of sigma subunit)
MDVDDLLRQCALLNEQVKLLVKTEHRLHLAQATIERQLGRLQALNRFLLASGGESEYRPILERALELLLETMRVDQAIAFVADDDGRLVPAAVATVDACGPPPDRTFCPPAGLVRADALTLTRPLVLPELQPVDDELRAERRLLDDVDAFFVAPGAPRRRLPFEIILPVRHRGHALLAVMVLRTVDPTVPTLSHLPSDKDLPFLELVCSHAEAAMENVRLLRETARKAALDKELEVARAVQESLVPTAELIEAAGMRLSSHYEPASSCSGDFWTWRALDRDRLLVVIGDIMGHGVPAALLAAVAFGCMHGTLPLVTPANVLLQLNRVLRDASQGRFWMSGFACVFDPAADAIEFAGAGHTPPYVIEPRGGRWTVGALAARGTLLGEREHPTIETQRRRLDRDGIVVFYTDGVSERRGPRGDHWGDRRFRHALTEALPPANEPVAPSRLRDHVVAGLRKFAGEQEPADDVTLVIAARASR